MAKRCPHGKLLRFECVACGRPAKPAKRSLSQQLQRPLTDPELEWLKEARKVWKEAFKMGVKLGSLYGDEALQREHDLWLTSKSRLSVVRKG